MINIAYSPTRACVAFVVGSVAGAWAASAYIAGIAYVAEAVCA